MQRRTPHSASLPSYSLSCANSSTLTAYFDSGNLSFEEGVM
jgi:hypothetical protein